MLKKKSLFDRVAEGLLKKQAEDENKLSEIDTVVADMEEFLDKEASVNKVAEEETKGDAKKKLKDLNEYEKELLEFCSTPRTYGRMKQLFTARDNNDKTVPIDGMIYKLVKDGFLSHKSDAYVTAPRFREFITVMPMTASKTSGGQNDAEAYIRKAITYGLDDPTIINKLVDSYNVDHSAAYDMIQDVKSGKTSYTEPSKGDLGGGMIDRTEREEYRESLIATKSFKLCAEEKASILEISAARYEWNGVDLLNYDTQEKVDINSLKLEDKILDNPDDVESSFMEKAVYTLPSDLYVDEVGYDRELQAPILKVYKEGSREAKKLQQKKANKQAASYVNYIGNNFKLNAQNIAHQAVAFTRKFLSNYRFPVAPQIKFNAIKNASTENDVLNGEVNLTLEFRTLSAVKKYIDISLPVKQGNFIEPSTMTVDGQSFIISQSAIDDITKNGTFYTNVNPKGMGTNPMHRNVMDSFKDKKVPKIKRNLFSV